MGLMWLFIGALLLGILSLIVDIRMDWEWPGWIGCILIVLAGVAIVLSLIVIVDSNIGAKARIISLEEQREKIVYNIETGLYTDRLDIKDVEIIDSIAKYNEDIRWGKAYQDDPWLGVFVPDIYDQFEPILYEGIKPTTPNLGI